MTQEVTIDVARISEKITRATLLYLDPRNPENKFAQCATCIHFIKDKGLCEWMSKNDEIDGGDSCGFYVPGKNSSGKPLGLMTPEEMGVVSRQVRCENCMFFDPNSEPRKHCDLYTQLNLILPVVFDLDRYVDEYGCCNAQTPGRRNPEVFKPFGPIMHGNETTGDSSSTSDKRVRTHDASMLDFAGYYAPEKIGTTRRITPEGFLVLEGTPIARTGEQIYMAHEINGDLSSDDPKYIRPNGAGHVIVSRVPDEVFHEETLASFEGKDFVIEHPPEGVDVTNWKNQTVGHVQNVRRGSGVEDDLVIADIIVKDPRAIEYVNKHLPELSAGYRADYEPVEPGRAIQRNIIGNHVAGVKAGRAGARVAVRDHSITIGDDNMPQKKAWPTLRAVLATLGVKTEDASKIEGAVTLDAKEDEEEGEEKGELAKDMRAIKDWIKARDAEREEEKRKEKEAEDRKAHDAEEANKKAAHAAAEMASHEAVGDTLLEAEGPGMTVNLGKTWKGSMTGDSATEPVLTAVNARAELLAPGIQKLTADAVKGNQGKVLAGFMRDALAQHAASPLGKQNVQAFLVGDSIDALKGERLVGIFNGVSQLARMKNNQASLLLSHRTTSDGKGGPISNSELNARNRKYWADQATAARK